jgi:hypothetical protein
MLNNRKMGADAPIPLWDNCRHLEEPERFLSHLILSGFDERDFSNPSASLLQNEAPEGRPAAASIAGFSRKRTCHAVPREGP